MPTVPIKVPGVGESISEGILSKWLKSDGSAVASGEPLFELETDKASTVVPAPAAGILKIGTAEGETVAVGAIVGSLDPVGTPAAATPVSTPSKPEEPALAPSARRLAAESIVDVSKIEGTGRGGRITKGDVIEHLAAKESPTPAVAVAVAAEASAPTAAAEPSRTRETRQRMSGIRRTIAQRLVEAQQTAAILTTFNEADVSRISDLRTRYKDAFKSKHGINLGYSSFFVKAVIEALKAFPAVNARIDGNDIVYHHHYDIGVAVSTDRGLMVPVLRDADALSFAAIEKKIAEFAAKAREGTIAIPDLQGGTFTITNGGVFGSLLSTPILNPPQSGILGMHAIQKRPVALDDQVVIRPMMYLALSYDHRIIDGREAVSFLVRVKECVESPERLLLEV